MDKIQKEFKTVTDQMGDQMHFSYPPCRIISLVPSQTELLFDLGLDDRILGITKFCVHPKQKVKQKQNIGGTKKFHFDKIDQLKPDLIIGNKEENYKEGIEKLKEKYPVWMSDITTLKEALQMMKSIGEMVGKAEVAKLLGDSIKNNFNTFQSPENKRVLYFIWKDPYMVAANDTFINEMLKKCGYSNLVKDQTRYPILSKRQIIDYNPELILLSSEPYPFKTKHISEFRSLCPKANIKLVDGEMFSWYGSRLQYAIPYFEQITSDYI